MGDVARVDLAAGARLAGMPRWRLRMRTREGMAVARAKGKLRGKAPKLSARQDRELHKMHVTGDYTIADLAELFSISRASVYRALKRQQSTN